MTIESYEKETKPSEVGREATYIPYTAKEENSDQDAEDYLDRQLDLCDKPFSIPDTIKPLEL